jgi:hypothetical protein
MESFRHAALKKPVQLRRLSSGSEWERAVAAEGMGGYIAELPVLYHGESLSPWSFFTQFPTIIFRWRGSVLPFIVFEIGIAVVVSFVALAVCGGLSWSYSEEAVSEKGHIFVGTLLAFLTVFRSQSAWNMFIEGFQEYCRLTVRATARSERAPVPSTAQTNCAPPLPPNDGAIVQGT